MHERHAIAEIHAYLRRASVRAAGPDFCAYPYPDVAVGYRTEVAWPIR